MKYQIFSGGPFMVNTYIIYNEKTKDGVIIDPGIPVNKLKSFIMSKKINISRILLTHGHVDHILHINHAKDMIPSAEICMNKEDLEVYNQARQMAAYFGILHVEHPYQVDFFLEDGMVIEIGDESLKVIETPGHSPGSVCFLCENEFIVTGDTLFAEGIGRTDLPGGSYKDIMKSIKTKLLNLDDSLIVLPGHGPHTNIGHEKKYNPFLTGEFF